jgi:hypothetical protein
MKTGGNPEKSLKSLFQIYYAIQLFFWNQNRLSTSPAINKNLKKVAKIAKICEKTSPYFFFKYHFGMRMAYKIPLKTYRKKFIL